MNIFYLDKSPKKSAQQHYNKHVVKMILESAQLLCTAHHIKGNPSDVPYKKTHQNHPSAVWVRSSRQNYMWCYYYMLSLGEEYTKRYGKIHKTISKCKEILSKIPKEIEKTDFTQPPQCMPEEFKSECSIDAYRKYYQIGKAHLMDK